MRFGFVLPQSELPFGVHAVSEFAATVEHSGFDHLVVYDHVLGADPSRRDAWSGFYTIDDPFHEPLVLYGFLAGRTTLELFTGVLVLPQRQIALVAKQAAEVDILSEGRLRLGVGIGWNAVEYEALGVDFSTRARRFEEQIELLRTFWTTPSVDFDGAFHTITAAGLNPLPIQRPIPLWLGGGRNSPPSALRRIGRLADGWYPNTFEMGDFDRARELVLEGAAEVGRPEPPELEGMVADVVGLTPARLIERIEAWRIRGASRVSFRALGQGLDFAGHLRAVETIGDVIADIRAGQWRTSS